VDGTRGPGNASGSLCVDHINEKRDSIGLGPLARWESGESCADEQAQSDAGSGEAHGAFGDCGESAQNECPGWPAPPESMIGDCLDMMWDEGPGGGHYENMSDTTRSEVACGFFTTTGGEVWAIQNFR
jgi:hypothetical protein